MLLGNGDGTFQPAVTTRPAADPGAVAVGDFNGDGKPDLAVADWSRPTLSACCWATATAPSSPRPTTPTGTGPDAVAVADFNGDGHLDVVATDEDSNAFSVMLGDGAGGFGAASEYATGTGPDSIAVADFNGDGVPDLVTANGVAGTVSVLLGNGKGGFGPATDYATGSDPDSVAVGDFNGDGVPDLAVANYNSNTVSVLLGNGKGGFGPATDYASGSGPKSVAVGDFNGDGVPDLVTANGVAGTVSVLLGNGDGTFQPKIDSTTGGLPNSVAVADLNGDGKADLVLASWNWGVILLFGNGAGGFGPPNGFGTGFFQSVTVADLNGDGVPDLVTANEGSVSVLLGNGSGGFGAPTNYATGTSSNSVAVGDFNGDGVPDLAIANDGSNSVTVLLGNGTGGFTAAADYATGASPASIAVGDFNGGGKADLVTADVGANTVSVLLNTTPKAAVAETAPSDGVWYFHVRAVDGLGNGGPTTTLPVCIDTTPPTTTDDADAAWHSTPVTVSLTATDPNMPNASGVAYTKYSLDGGTTWTQGTSVTIPAPSDHSNDGLHTVSYYSVDNAGNTEATETCTVKIDTTPPTTTVSGADSLWHNSDVNLTLAATDNGGSGVAATYYQIDGGAWTEGTSVNIPAPADHSNDGLHTVSYYSTDNAGNTEATQSCTVKIDTTPPVISLAYLSVSHHQRHSGWAWHRGFTTRGHQASWRGWTCHGSCLNLSYRIDDNLSPTVNVTLTVLGFRGKVLQTISLGQCPTGVLEVYCLPHKLPHGCSHLRLTATDLAGNAQSKLVGFRLFM